MKISEIMTTNVTTIDRNEKVEKAFEIMEQKDIRHLIVTRDGNLESIVSDRDLLVVISLPSPENYQENPIKVGQLSTKHPITLEPDTSVLEAAEQVLDKKVSAFPVQENGKLKGIVTTHDLVRVLIEKLKK